MIPTMPAPGTPPSLHHLCIAGVGLEDARGDIRKQLNEHENHQP